MVTTKKSMVPTKEPMVSTKEKLVSQNYDLGHERVAVAPFELKISPNGSYTRAASFETPPGAQNGHI